MRTVRMTLRLLCATAAMIGLVATAPQARNETAGDQAIYAELLTRHLRQGLMDYRGLKRDETLLDRYLESLAQVQPESLTSAARFAFWINAYNAWTLKLILMHYPGINSIKEAGSWLRSPWKRRFVRQRDRLLSLDEIEQDILRPQFNDPRVHFAINCASKGCPPLYPEPFSAKDLAHQLDQAARRFINDPARYRLAGHTIFISRIFKWYAEDFDHDPLDFMRRYAQGGLAVLLADKGLRLEVDYLDYDWSLNGQ
jgi:hypothetical protein